MKCLKRKQTNYHVRYCSHSPKTPDQYHHKGTVLMPEQSSRETPQNAAYTISYKRLFFFKVHS